MYLALRAVLAWAAVLVLWHGGQTARRLGGVWSECELMWSTSVASPSHPVYASWQVYASRMRMW